MTRKRAAHLANLEDAALHKRIDNDSGSPEGPISSICLCQPDPKIPRPRNAFILYRQRHQQNIIAQHPGLPNPEISKIAGELWRAEPDNVKNEWKLLAEEEKSRHAQQYPDYRFQPRHKVKSSPTSATGDKQRCSKCGGRSIIATGSPFPIPTPSFSTPDLTPRRPASLLAGGRGSLSPPTPSTDINKAETPGRRQLQMLQGLTIANSPRSDPRMQTATSPMGSRYPETNADDGSLEAKRRRYNGYNPNTPRQETARPMTAGLQNPNQYPYPTPRGFDGRRGSLPPPPAGVPFPATRPGGGRLSLSPPNGPPHTANAFMGQSSRIYPPSRTGLHVYPVTPITAHSPHGQPLSGRVRHDSESLRLPPLLSPGLSDQSRSVEAMIMSMPYLGKIKILRRVAPPLKSPSPTSPGVHIRGSLISVEGEDKDSVDGVLRHLADSLKRFDEFDVRIEPGPKEPEGRVGLKEFLTEVAAWHDKTQEMINFITGVGTGPELLQQQAEQKNGKSTTNSQQDSTEVDNMELDEDMEAGEIVEGSRRSSQDRGHKPRARELERKKEEMKQSIERESEKRRQSEQYEKERKIPLLLVSQYILHASDAWASAVPINDVYSPPDHWQWIATLWRGIVGSDLTVYVKCMDKEEPVSATSTENWLAGKPTVDMREDVGALVLKKEKGKTDDGAIRRMAFEVGEHARAVAANAAKIA